MKTQFTVDKEFIKEAYNSACPDWKAKLKNKFPQAFESELENGKWYKMNEYLFNYQGVERDSICGYGFDFKPFTNNGVEYFEKCRIFCVVKKDIVEPATDEEVKTALIAEAKRRGLLNKGVKLISSLSDGYTTTIDKLNLKYIDDTNSLISNYGGYDSVCLFKDGKFAKILSEPIEVTLEQIAEKFNVNVEQLKIKK